MFARAVARIGVGTLLVGALAASTTGPPASAATYYPWGSTASADHVLRKGCHNYRYRYSVTPPTDEWAAEIFVANRRGEPLASAAVDSAVDPARGSLRMRICRASTFYGRHTIKMKVTWQQHRATTAGFVTPSTFRFKRPAR